MKPVRAWAIVDRYGRLVVYDHRLPLCWVRNPAKNESRRYQDCERIVRVEIREVPRKGKRWTLAREAGGGRDEAMR
jgi:hypothetical protein